MNSWFLTTCRAFILTAFISFTIGIFGNTEISTNGYITAYSITIFVILLLLTYFISILIRGEISTLSILYMFLMGMGPLVFMLVVLSLVVYVIFKYRTNIIKNDIGGDYIWYSESIVLVVLLQLLAIYVMLRDDRFERTGQMSQLTSSILYLLGVFSLMSYIPMYNILHFYTTDGFIPAI